MVTNQPTSAVPKLPNLVYILNDDTDVLLGGAASLVQTRKLLGDAGADFTQFRTLSPNSQPDRPTCGPPLPQCEASPKAFLATPYSSGGRLESIDHVRRRRAVSNVALPWLLDKCGWKNPQRAKGVPVQSRGHNVTEYLRMSPLCAGHVAIT